MTIRAEAWVVSRDRIALLAARCPLEMLVTLVAWDTQPRSSAADLLADW